jgi:hypothetical protein
MSDLGKWLSLDAKAAASSGQIDQTLRRGLDQLKLSDVIAHGGLTADYFFGIEVLEQGLKDLRTAMPKLNAEQCKRVADALKAIEARWEPIAVLKKREEVYFWNAAGWSTRVHIVVAWLHGEPSPCSRFISNLEDKRNRSRATLRLLQATVALRRFELEQGSRPASLTEFVPRYLTSVPIDPYGGRPIRYKRLESGHQLYSVGQNRVDDGGKLVSSSSVWDGDLFLEAWDVDAAEAKAAAEEAAKAAAAGYPASPDD